MKEAVLASIIVVLVIAGLGVSYYLNGPSSPPTSCCTTSTATNPELGIQLTLSLNATATRPGGHIGFQAFIRNDLGSENNVSASNGWSIPRLISPCSPVGLPFAVVTISGHYEETNVSSAPTPQPGVDCTTTAGRVTGYSFQANSSSAYVIRDGQFCGPPPCVPMMVIGTSGVIVGYMSNGQASPFVRGSYTVVVEDEWGDMALASFTVG